MLYRRAGPGLEVLLVHPGGPFWAKKDDGVWSIPKGLVDSDEDFLAAARREFEEETGALLPSRSDLRSSSPLASGEAIPLGDFKQKGGKIVTAFAVEGDFDLAQFRSKTFSMEWPPRSGKRTEFPETDRAGWFGLDEARRKLLAGQVAMPDALAAKAG